MSQERPRGGGRTVTQDWDPVLVRNCLEHARRLAADTPRHHGHLMMTPLRRDPHATFFLRTWRNDGAAHARILHRVLASELFRDVAADDGPLPESLNLVPHTTGALFAGSWLAPRSMLGVALSTAVVNELSAFLRYSRLARCQPNRELGEILDRLAADARRHARGFGYFARPLLDGSRLARRLARGYFAHAWCPAGDRWDPDGSWRELAALWSATDAADPLPRLDELSSTVLGFSMTPSFAPGY